MAEKSVSPVLLKCRYYNNYKEITGELWTRTRRNQKNQKLKNVEKIKIKKQTEKKNFVQLENIFSCTKL